MDMTRGLEDARLAVTRWRAATPRTAKRNRAAAEAIERYVHVDELLASGAALPGPWAARSVVLPTVEEVAEALALVGMAMPIHEASVKTIATCIVRVMRDRRSPRGAADDH